MYWRFTRHCKNSFSEMISLCLMYWRAGTQHYWNFSWIKTARKSEKSHCSSVIPVNLILTFEKVGECPIRTFQPLTDQWMQFEWKLLQQPTISWPRDWNQINTTSSPKWRKCCQLPVSTNLLKAVWTSINMFFQEKKDCSQTERVSSGIAYLVYLIYQ